MYAQERQQWYQAIQQQQARIAELERENSGFKRAQELRAQQEAISEAINTELYNNLETVDPSDAQRIVNAVISAMSGPLTDMQQRIAQSQRDYDARIAQQNHAAYQHQAEATRAAVLQAHPDYMQFANSPEYTAFLQERDGFSSETRLDRAVREFNAGNSAFIIDMFNQFKNRGNTALNAASVVPPMETPTSYAGGVESTNQPELSHTELLRLMQTHAITPDEFRIQMENIRKRSAQ